MSHFWLFLEALAKHFRQPNAVELLSKDISKMSNEQKETALGQLTVVNQEAPLLAAMLRKS
jgi:hypothetical protein